MTSTLSVGIGIGLGVRTALLRRELLSCNPTTRGVKPAARREAMSKSPEGSWERISTCGRPSRPHRYAFVRMGTVIGPLAGEVPEPLTEAEWREIQERLRGSAMSSVYIPRSDVEKLVENSSRWAPHALRKRRPLAR